MCSITDQSRRVLRKQASTPGWNIRRLPPAVISSQKVWEEGQDDGFIFRGRKAFPPGRGREVPEALFVFLHQYCNVW